MNLQFKKIEISDKPFFNACLAGRKHENIFFNFTSLYIWQDWDPFVWTEIDGAACVRGTYGHRDAALPPLAATDQAILHATERMIQHYRARGIPFLMTEVTDSYVQLYQAAWPNRFRVHEYRAGANYIYRVEDLALLRGRRYSGKRNHIHQFKRANPETVLLPLTEREIPLCLALFDEWAKHKENQLDSKLERMGLVRAFDHMADLDYRGACLYSGEQMIGFTLGEPLDAETVGIHIEKADYSYHGAFTVLNQLFLQNDWMDYTYVNRAEDMGDEGMRIAKLSYHPCALNMKYNLTLQAEE